MEIKMPSQHFMNSRDPVLPPAPAGLVRTWSRGRAGSLTSHTLNSTAPDVLHHRHAEKGSAMHRYFKILSSEVCAVKSWCAY